MYTKTVKQCRTLCSDIRLCGSSFSLMRAGNTVWPGFNFLFSKMNNRGGGVPQLVALLMQVWFHGAARYFSPTVNFQCRLSYSVHTPMCAMACFHICEHVKDPIAHVRVRWIMETLKHPAHTVGWAVWLCCGWFSLWKATRISQGKNPTGAIQCKKVVFFQKFSSCPLPKQKSYIHWV